MIPVAFETRLNYLYVDSNSLNLKVCGPSYGILNRVQLSEKKQSPLAGRQLLLYFYFFNFFTLFRAEYYYEMTFMVLL